MIQPRAGPDRFAVNLGLVFTRRFRVKQFILCLAGSVRGHFELGVRMKNFCDLSVYATIVTSEENPGGDSER